MYSYSFSAKLAFANTTLEFRAYHVWCADLPNISARIMPLMVIQSTAIVGVEFITDGRHQIGISAIDEIRRIQIRYRLTISSRSSILPFSGCYQGSLATHRGDLGSSSLLYMGEGVNMRKKRVRPQTEQHVLDTQAYRILIRLQRSLFFSPPSPADAPARRPIVDLTSMHFLES